MNKYPSTLEITSEMDAVLRETKMTPEEHWAFLIENGIINRNGRVLCGKSWVSVVHEENGATQIFDFQLPWDLLQQYGATGISRSYVPRFEVRANQRANELSFDWIGQNRPGKLESLVAAKIKMRSDWIERFNKLVDEVDQWAKAMNWPTRRKEQKFDDMQIGKHELPTLLMQADDCQVILLEPIGLSCGGRGNGRAKISSTTAGEIADLNFYEDRWNLHVFDPKFNGTNALEPTEQGVPFSHVA